MKLSAKPSSSSSSSTSASLASVPSQTQIQHLLHEVILAVGYFTLLNKDNQTVVQSGSRPSILQQLCLLPFQYFSDPKLRAILFPTLVAACYENDENRRVVEQDLSCILLANFIDENVMAQESSTSALKLDVTQAFASATSSADLRGNDLRFSLEMRLPNSMWPKVADYFKKSVKKNDA